MGKVKITGVTNATQEFFEDWMPGRETVTAAGTTIDFAPEAKVLYIYTDAAVRISFNDTVELFDMLPADSPIIVPLVCSKLYLKTYSGSAVVRYFALR